MSIYLDKYKGIQDLKNMTSDEINELAKDIRKFLIKTISKTGGHLASNLGVVELTLALHTIYDTSIDKIIFDVGHQSYVHKILTGRKNEFANLRQFGGISGFPKRKESIHDCFETGHSSTSISAGLGIAYGRDITNENYKVASIIGDGALTGGLALEALNHLGSLKTNMLVILNDNDMSICKNVGGLSNSLYKLRMTKTYRKFSRKLENLLSSVPIVGSNFTKTAIKVKDSLKHLVMPGAFFEEMGIKYFGPVDGHDYKSLVHALIELNNVEGPKLLHVLTVKGKGYKYAQENPSMYHGVCKFDISKGVEISNQITYSNIVGNKLNEIFKKDNKSIAITAAMISGTGIDELYLNYPKRVIDVGIAEEHAVTLAAGLCTTGIRPFFVVYSTFLQRAYDQILHDVCIQNLPVVFLVDRAGLVGEDGETHHGVFDIGFLSTIPNITIMAPRDSVELNNMIEFAHSFDKPIAIRYPRGKAINLNYERLDNLLQWETLSEESNVAILAVGKMVELALEINDYLNNKGINVSIINARCIKPMDNDIIKKISKNKRFIFTIEDHVYTGGFGSQLLPQLYNYDFDGLFKAFSLPDEFIEHGNVDILFSKYGLDKKQISNEIIRIIKYNTKFEEI